MGGGVVVVWGVRGMGRVDLKRCCFPGIVPGGGVVELSTAGGLESGCWAVGGQGDGV